jgi:hypothetical protein
MSASLAFHVVSHGLTLNVLLLIAFWRQWRTATGWALLQFIASMVFLQGVTLLVAVGLWAGAADRLVKDLATVSIIGFFLVILTSLALLLHAAQSVGVINAHETTAGRVFKDRDQTIIEMFAPYTP